MYEMPPTKGGIFLVLRDTVAEDFIVANRIVIDTATISRVSFHGIDDSVLDLLYDTRMV